MLEYPIRAVITKSHLDALSEKRIFLSGEKDWTPGWAIEGSVVRLTAPVRVEPYSNFRKGNCFFSMGSFSYSRSVFDSKICVGRYCAIADKVEIMGTNHPLDRLSTCGFDYSPNNPIFRAAEADVGKKIEKKYPTGRDLPAPKIGNDVWIGSGVLLARGITIGDGAVIAARSIVTKDVPAYALVAGSPATVKRYRFDEDTVRALQGSKWWNYRFTDFQGMNTLDPLLFVDQLTDALQSGKLSPYSPEPVLLHELLGNES